MSASSLHTPDIEVPHGLAESFLLALLAANRIQAWQLVAQELHRGVPVTDISLRVIQPVMKQIGDLWAEGKISIAAEHTATAITQFVVSSMYPFMDSRQPTKGTAVVAGIAGEMHQLGPHMVSDALESDGWEVVFLGTNCQLDDMKAACVRANPSLVALSCTMRANLNELRRVIHSLKCLNASGHRPKFLVGGQAFDKGLAAHSLAKDLGADGFATDLSGAVVQARAWANV